MVRKNSLARDFMTNATLGFSGVSAKAEETGNATDAAASIATARRRPANDSFMGSLRSYDYFEQRLRWRRLHCAHRWITTASTAQTFARPNYANPADICQ